MRITSITIDYRTNKVRFEIADKHNHIIGIAALDIVNHANLLELANQAKEQILAQLKETT